MSTWKWVFVCPSCGRHLQLYEVEFVFRYRRGHNDKEDSKGKGTETQVTSDSPQ